MCLFLLSGCSFLSRFGLGGGNNNNDTTTVPAPIGQDTLVRVEEVQLSANALQDYRGQYQSDQSPKAFAVSPSGAFGVAFNASSVDEAQRAALEKCMQDVRSGDLECVIYDVNGRPVLRVPTELRRVP